MLYRLNLLNLVLDFFGKRKGYYAVFVACELFFNAVYDKRKGWRAKVIYKFYSRLLFGFDSKGLRFATLSYPRNFYITLRTQVLKRRILPPIRNGRENFD